MGAYRALSFNLLSRQKKTSFFIYFAACFPQKCLNNGSLRNFFTTVNFKGIIHSMYIYVHMYAENRSYAKKKEKKDHDWRQANKATKLVVRNKKYNVLSNGFLSKNNNT